MIADTIEMLRKGDYYGAGEMTEIAKGKKQLITNWSAGLRKTKRKIEAKKWLKRLLKL